MLRAQNKLSCVAMRTSTTRTFQRAHYSGNTTPVKTVGFIGLGNMGQKMALNIQKKFKLVVFDINNKSAQPLLDKGATFAKPQDMAKQVDALVTMLPSSPHVRDVYLNPSSGILASIQPNSLLIDASTIDPATAKEVAAKAAEKGATMIDAPVSGGVLGAENATLTFMVGGSVENFERAKPLLSHMGKNIVHCGDTGTGQIAKICNNLVLAISMIGVSEAMNLGISLGIDAKALAGIFNTSSARCWSSEVYNPVPGVLPNAPSSRGYTGGFGVDLMAKDIGLAVNAANSVKAPLPLGGSALQWYNLISKSGAGGKDFSYIYEFLANSKKIN